MGPGIAYRIVAIAIAVLAAATPARAASEATSPAPAPAASVPSPSPDDDGAMLAYPLHEGEDPSRVAQLFGVPIDELLALNRVSDPRRIAAGTVLKIPDPRATRVAELRGERDRLTGELATARQELATVDARLARLSADLDGLRTANQDLEARLTWYSLWRTASLLAAAAAFALAFIAILALARARDADRRRIDALRDAATMRGALEKYRQLGAQLELRYQSLFAQSQSVAAVGPQAQRLRSDYEARVVQLDDALPGEAVADPAPPARKRA
jgi:LysM repeat protein